MKKTLTPLIPPDRKQCQAMKPNGNSFMTLGGVSGLVRCATTPTVIAKENSPGDDGRKGSMALCDPCAAKLVEQAGANYARLIPIRKSSRTPKETKRNDDF